MSDDSQTVVTICPHCGRKSRAWAADLGRTARCKCGQTFCVTVESATDAPAPDAPSPALPVAADGAAAMPAVSDGAQPMVAVPAATEIPPAAMSSPTAAAACVWHSGVSAEYACAVCGRPMCGVCKFSRFDGACVCPECINKPPTTAPLYGTPAFGQGAYAAGGGPAWAPAGAANWPVQAPLGLGPGVKCETHPEADAAGICATCGKKICSTCLFTFPPNIQLCPTCAAAPPSTTLSSGRKTILVVAVIAAVLAAFGLVVMLTGAAEGMSEDEAQIVFTILFVPALVSLALGIASFDRRAGNPPIVWIIGLSGIVMGAIYLLLVVVGALAMAG